MARGNAIHVDGKSSVDQGDYFPAQSIGSKTVRCDLDSLFNWWDTIRPADPTPEPIPVDENGVSYRLCSGYESGSHYAPRRAFNKHKGRKDGLNDECRQCQHERNLRLKIMHFARRY
jgi:hypothetical protein